MLSSSSTFPWRRRRGDLAGHGEGGRWRKVWRNGGHGGDLRSGEDEEDEEVERVC